MEREEKGHGESERKKQRGSSMVKKLKRGVYVGKRGGLCSTPPPIWRLELNSEPHTNEPNSEFLNLGITSTTATSARNLCASLWEFESYQYPVAQMRRRGGKLRHKHRNNNGDGLDTPTSSYHDQPATAGSFRQLVSASLIQHHQAVESNGYALQPLSPASCSSSKEMAPYKGKKMGESICGLKTSTELLRVLNRIWILEEQHASNQSLVRALKLELDHSHAIIKKLLHEKQWDRHEMDDLMKQVTENRFVWKNQDGGRITFQLVKDELEGERKLRKHSESLHRKLARELSEVKSAFFNALRELERERKARILLENLCDEFSKGIREYEQEVRHLLHKPEKDQSGLACPDRLIVHISEAWLDERLQMKIAEAQDDICERDTIVDKLGFDIETFLEAKRSGGSKVNNVISQKELKENCSRRHSLESLTLNEAVSAPGNAAEDSTDSDFHCLEAVKSRSGKQIVQSCTQRKNDDAEGRYVGIEKSNSRRRKVTQEHIKGNILSGLQGQFKEHMARSMSCKGNRTRAADREDGELGEENPALVHSNGISAYSDAIREDPHEIQSKRVAPHGLKSNHFESNSNMKTCIQSVFTGNASPVQLWKSNLTPPDFGKSEYSLDWPPDLDENTLMAKLLEARLEAKHSHTKNSKRPL